MLPIGSPAPDFSLVNQDRHPVSLSSFRGRQPVIVAFHPLAFTPICTAQVQTYEREQPRLRAHHAHVLAISNDANPSKKAWAESLGGVSFDLLSDYHPQGQVAEAYGVRRPDGLAERSVFLVDKDGIIRWGKVYGMDTTPDFEEVFAALTHL